MGLCMCKKRNLLLEILFPKDYWSREGVKQFIHNLWLEKHRLYDDVYSDYYFYIYEDKRLHTNLRHVTNPRRHMIFVYGDEK